MKHEATITPGARPLSMPKTVDRRASKRFTMAVVYLMAALLAIAFITPFLWMISSALKPDHQVFAIPPEWVPNPVRWSNFPDALRAMEFVKLLKNTLTVTALSVLGTVVSSTIVAYGFARLEWPGRDAVFFVCISTLMIPYFVTLVPLYIVYSKLNWINTYLPLIVPSFFGAPYFIFLLRQFFLTIPSEVSDAARVDGASELRIIVDIILPLTRPALLVVALFQFIRDWNDFLGPMIYLTDPDRYTLAIGLASFSDEHSFQFAFQMAGATVVVLPIVVIFFIGQRVFIEGISVTGIKG